MSLLQSWLFISAGSILATNRDEEYSGLLGIYSEADRILRGVMYPTDFARGMVRFVGINVALAIIAALAYGI